MQPLVQPLVTVSIPFYRTPPLLLRRAVTSILEQTFRDFRLILVNDGGGLAEWKALGGIADDRIVQFDLLVNGGRYLADAVVLAACDTLWFLPHDSDDWSDPNRLANLLAQTEGRSISKSANAPVDAVFSAECVHFADARGRERIVHVQVGGWSPANTVLKHRAHMSALWRTAFLKAIGGPHPGYRLAYDTFLTSAAFLASAAVGRIDAQHSPQYHRCVRSGSLRTSAETRLRSTARREAVAAMRQLWNAACHFVKRIPVEESDRRAEQIGLCMLLTVRPETRAAVLAEAWRLAMVIGQHRQQRQRWLDRVAPRQRTVQC